jgi:hypothetical protein
MATWKPDLTVPELVYRAHLQLKYWRDQDEPEKELFWQGRIDELLDQLIDDPALLVASRKGA